MKSVTMFEDSGEPTSVDSTKNGDANKNDSDVTCNKMAIKTVASTDEKQTSSDKVLLHNGQLKLGADTDSLDNVQIAVKKTLEPVSLNSIPEPPCDTEANSKPAIWENGDVDSSSEKENLNFDDGTSDGSLRLRVTDDEDSQESQKSLKSSIPAEEFGEDINNLDQMGSKIEGEGETTSEDKPVISALPTPEDKVTEDRKDPEFLIEDDAADNIKSDCSDTTDQLQNKADNGKCGNHLGGIDMPKADDIGSYCLEEHASVKSEKDKLSSGLGNTCEINEAAEECSGITSKSQSNNVNLSVKSVESEIKSMGLFQSSNLSDNNMDKSLSLESGGTTLEDFVVKDDTGTSGASVMVSDISNFHDNSKAISAVSASDEGKIETNSDKIMSVCVSQKYAVEELKVETKNKEMISIECDNHNSLELKIDCKSNESLIVQSDDKTSLDDVHKISESTYRNEEDNKVSAEHQLPVNSSPTVQSNTQPPSEALSDFEDSPTVVSHKTDDSNKDSLASNSAVQKDSNVSFNVGEEDSCTLNSSLETEVEKECDSLAQNELETSSQPEEIPLKSDVVVNGAGVVSCGKSVANPITTPKDDELCNNISPTLRDVENNKKTVIAERDNQIILCNEAIDADFTETNMLDSCSEGNINHCELSEGTRHLTEGEHFVSTSDKSRTEEKIDEENEAAKIKQEKSLEMVDSDLSVDCKDVVPSAVKVSDMVAVPSKPLTCALTGPENAAKSEKLTDKSANTSEETESPKAIQEKSVDMADDSDLSVGCQEESPNSVKVDDTVVEPSKALTCVHTSSDNCVKTDKSTDESVKTDDETKEPKTIQEKSLDMADRDLAVDCQEVLQSLVKVDDTVVEPSKMLTYVRTGSDSSVKTEKLTDKITKTDKETGTPKIIQEKSLDMADSDLSVDCQEVLQSSVKVDDALVKSSKTLTYTHTGSENSEKIDKPLDKNATTVLSRGSESSSIVVKELETIGEDVKNVSLSSYCENEVPLTLSDVANALKDAVDTVMLQDGEDVLLTRCDETDVLPEVCEPPNLPLLETQDKQAEESSNSDISTITTDIADDISQDADNRQAEGLPEVSRQTRKRPVQDALPERTSKRLRTPKASFVDSETASNSSSETTTAPKRQSTNLAQEKDPKKARVDGDLKRMSQNIENVLAPNGILSTKKMNRVSFIEKIRLEQLKGLTRQEMEEFLVETLCIALAHRYDLGVLRQKLQSLDNQADMWRKKTQLAQKQVRDMELVVKRFQNDLRSKKDRPVVPVKVTRSVGLQVSLHVPVKNNPTPPVSPNVSNITASPIVPTRGGPGSGRGVTNSAPLNTVVPATRTASKPGSFVKTLMPRQPPHQGSQTTSSSNQTPSPSARLQMGRSKIVNASNSTTPLKSAGPVIDLTDEGDRNRTSIPRTPVMNSVSTNTPTTTSQISTTTGSSIRVVQPQQLSAASATANTTMLTAPSANTRLTYFVPTSSNSLQQRQVLIASSSSQGSSGGVTVNSGQRNQVPALYLKTGSLVSVSPVGTSSPQTVGRGSNLQQASTSIQPATTASNMRSPLRGTTSVTTTQIREPPRSSTVLQHPAPLPAAPVTAAHSNSKFKKIPPKPDLKITKQNKHQGIVLSWNMPLTAEHDDIASYQLYAYQESNAVPSTTHWKKVGDVKALPLPMACTLTQFVEGHKYHFAVRAVDVHSRVGPFSAPGQIVLARR